MENIQKVSPDNSVSKWRKDFYWIYIRSIDEYKLYKELDNINCPAMNTLYEWERKQLAIDLCTKLSIPYFNVTRINIETLSE